MGIVLLHSDIEIRKIIGRAAFDKIDAVLAGQGSLFEREVKKILRTYIESSDVWRSVAGDNDVGLDGHFGIPKEENQARLAAIMDELLSQVRIEIGKTIETGPIFSKSIKIMAIESDWRKLSDMSAGLTIAPPTKAVDEEKYIYWLDWLLTGEVRPIPRINEYQIKFDLDSRNSRSGKAVMRKSPDSYEWPDDLAGGQPTTEDNFVTRQLNEIARNKKTFEKIFRESLNALQ